MITPHSKILIAEIEAKLSAFYQRHADYQFTDFLLSPESLEALKQEKTKNLGSIYLWGDFSKNEVFVGAHFDQIIFESLEQANPLEKLSNENLNAFCVLVEEISHFQTLIHRIEAEQPLNFVELEWQAEIDKVLICAMLLKEQCGNPHYHQLTRSLFDQSYIYAAERNRYWDATRHAAQFWHDIITYLDGIDDPQNSENLKSLLRTMSYSTWQEKLRNLTFPFAA